MTIVIYKDRAPSYDQVLEDLRASQILVKLEIGTCNVVEAKSGTVRSVGRDVIDADWWIFRPPNFSHNYPTRRATIQYDGLPAYLKATVDRRSDCHSPSRPSDMYGPNPKVVELFQRLDVQHDNYNVHMGEIFGDAVLVTDLRVHHAIHPHLAATSNALADLAGDYTTPHRVARIGCGAPTILFEAEPTEDDLVNLTLMFA